MKICFVSHSSRDGGAERVLLETIELLRGEGIECCVLLPTSGHLSRELIRQDIRFSVISFPMWVSKGKPSFLLKVRTALNLFKDIPHAAWRIFRWKCDVVYSNTATVCVGGFAARLLKLPHIWHLHEFGFEDHGLSFVFGRERSLRIIDRLSAGCICVSKSLADNYLTSIVPSKIRVIYPSVHGALRNADQGSEAVVLRSDRFRCVIVGALTAGKGQEDAVLAVGHLKSAGIEAELMVLGEGERHYRCHLDTVVEANQLKGDVVFLGAVPNALPAMRSADVVLICSRSEAFGRVTIEAMLAGKPVIGARSGATEELIQAGLNGLLYETGDPRDLAKQIRYLYDNPRIAEALGRSAKEWVEQHFSQNRVTEKLLAVLTPLSRDAAAIRPI